MSKENQRQASGEKDISGSRSNFDGILDVEDSKLKIEEELGKLHNAVDLNTKSIRNLRKVQIDNFTAIMGEMDSLKEWNLQKHLKENGNIVRNEVIHGTKALYEHISRYNEEVRANSAEMRRQVNNQMLQSQGTVLMEFQKFCKEIRVEIQNLRKELADTKNVNHNLQREVRDMKMSMLPEMIQFPGGLRYVTYRVDQPTSVQRPREYPQRSESSHRQLPLQTSLPYHHHHHTLNLQPHQQHPKPRNTFSNERQDVRPLPIENQRIPHQRLPHLPHPQHLSHPQHPHVSQTQVSYHQGAAKSMNYFQNTSNFVREGRYRPDNSRKQDFNFNQKQEIPITTEERGVGSKEHHEVDEVVENETVNIEEGGIDGVREKEVKDASDTVDLENEEKDPNQETMEKFVPDKTVETEAEETIKRSKEEEEEEVEVKKFDDQEGVEERRIVEDEKPTDEVVQQSTETSEPVKKLAQKKGTMEQIDEEGKKMLEEKLLQVEKEIEEEFRKKKKNKSEPPSPETQKEEVQNPSKNALSNPSGSNKRKTRRGRKKKKGKGQGQGKIAKGRRGRTKGKGQMTKEEEDRFFANLKRDNLEREERLFLKKREVDSRQLSELKRKVKESEENNAMTQNEIKSLREAGRRGVEKVEHRIMEVTKHPTITNLPGNLEWEKMGKMLEEMKPFETESTSNFQIPMSYKAMENAYKKNGEGKE